MVYARHIHRSVSCRADIPGAPWQVYDEYLVLPWKRIVCGARLWRDESGAQAPIRSVFRIGFPYARSSRGQFKQKWMMVPVLNQEDQS